MEKFKNKVIRKHVHWNTVRIELGDLKVDQDFFALLSKHPTMSKDRCAYNALKKHYSTTAIRYYRFTGEWPDEL